MTPAKYVALEGDELTALSGLQDGSVITGHLRFRDTVSEAGNDAHRMARSSPVTVFKIVAVGTYGPEV